MKRNSSNSSSVFVLGTGDSLLHYRKELSAFKVCSDKKANTIGFHRFFPFGWKEFEIIPNIWTWLDPAAAMDGLKYLATCSSSEFDLIADNMHIMIPEFVTKDYSEFRKHSGTTSLGRGIGRWQSYISKLLYVERRGMSVSTIDSISSKSTKVKEIITNPEVRFSQSDKLIIGSVEYDSESVLGIQNLWGIENKLTSYILPLSYYLGFDKVYVAGIDYVGGRLYKQYDKRHPWNDETQNKDQYKLSLDILRWWQKNEKYHEMQIFSCVEPEHTKLTEILEYVPIDEVDEWL